jgi:bacterioferritin-associated ferredoxin
MIICVCHRISDRDIARMVRDGCASFDELQFELAVATCCGKCHDSARETFDAHRAQMAADGQAAERGDEAGRHRHRVIPIASHPHHDRAASATA